MELYCGCHTVGCTVLYCVLYSTPHSEMYPTVLYSPVNVCFTGWFAASAPHTRDPSICLQWQWQWRWGHCSLPACRGEG